MENLILTKKNNFKEGKIVNRPNRFILEVKFGSDLERVYLPNPGALTTVIDENRKVLCEFAGSEDRKTEYNAFAIQVKDFFVTVDSTFANSIFHEILKKNLISDFDNYTFESREPSLPDYGRSDFLLRNEDGSRAFVEIKSCTHVEDGIAKFPDRPTKRGRRHLRSLRKIVGKGEEAYIFFIVQRPDAKEFRPFRDIDEEFANILSEVSSSGVGVRALSTKFEPPKIYLEQRDLDVVLG